jgi:serine/threonine protein kinase
VALKVFPETLCSRSEWENRLQQGADLWASLAHPQIVPVHRAGWLDGSPYLAYEFVPQGGLAAKLGGPLFPLRQAVRLVEQLAEIVGYLHRQGAVHGNLKPSNVLLAADGIPRIADFRLTGGLFQGPLPAADEEPAGIAYLTPEFVRDRSAEPRPYTDIYGLGLILYELLTGRPAIVGSTAEDALEHVCSVEPLPPSQFNSEVTPHLESLCLRCLRKNPWRRFVRAFDVATRLRQFLDNPEGSLVPGQRQRRPGRERAD